MGKPDAHVDKHSYSHTSLLYMHTMRTYITAAVQWDMSVNEVRKVLSFHFYACDYVQNPKKVHRLLLKCSYKVTLLHLFGVSEFS